MKTLTRLRVIIALVLASVLLSSCGVKQAILPLEPTEFIKSTGTDTTQRNARIPFEHSWRDPDVTITDYKYIVIRPVTTKYLKPAELEDSTVHRKRAEKLAIHFTRNLNTAFSDPLCIFYKTNQTTRPNTLVLEIALTDVHFQTEDHSQIPICAFEGRVTDATTGKLVSTVADRRGPDLHLGGDHIHITNAEEICSIWARQLMEASNREIFENVRRKLITIDSPH